MRIAIDLDEVLADTLPVVINFHNQIYGTSFSKRDFTSLRYWEIWGGTKEDAALKLSAFNNSEYMNMIEPMRGAVRAVDFLNNYHDLVVVTARPEEIMSKTIGWLEKNFPKQFSDVHFSKHFSQKSDKKQKWEICKEIRADVLVEDNLDYAYECAERGIKTVVFNTPWNQGDLRQNMKRAGSWLEIKSLLGTPDFLGSNLSPGL